MLADEIDLRDGKEMTRQGHPGREFFVLLEGTADVRKNGRKINSLGPGDFFGEIALVSREPRTATVTATSPLRRTASNRSASASAIFPRSAAASSSESVRSGDWKATLKAIDFFPSPT